MSPSDTQPTLDDEWGKLKTKEDFYSPADFAVKKQYLSAMVDKYGWSAALPDGFGYPSAVSADVSKAPPCVKTEVNKESVEKHQSRPSKSSKGKLHKKMNKQPNIPTKDSSDSGAAVEKKERESTKAGEPGEVTSEQDVSSKRAEGEKDKEQKRSLADKETIPMLQPGFLQPKLSKGQKKRVKEKAKKKQQAVELEKEATFWNEMAEWAKAENAAATTSDEALESKETPSTAAEPADKQAELISLMTEVYLEVDPDAIQANAEMEAIHQGRIVEPDDADTEEASEFCLRPKSSEQDSKFLDQKMQEYLEHVRRQDTAPLEPSSNIYPVNSVGAYLQEIMVTMSADSFWKDLMIPIETAVGILQENPDDAARKKASALIAGSRENCGNIHLFQDEQRIMGAVVKLLRKSDTSLHTVVPAEEFRKIKATKGMDAMKQYSPNDLEKLCK